MTTVTPQHPDWPTGGRPSPSWSNLPTSAARWNGRFARTRRATCAASTVPWRALELFDLTAADTRWRGPRRREILRAREEFCRLFFSATLPENSIPGLQRYFLYAAIAANRQRAASIPGDSGTRVAVRD